MRDELVHNDDDYSRRRKKKRSKMKDQGFFKDVVRKILAVERDVKKGKNK